jgi:RHS repeat-associated protein
VRQKFTGYEHDAETGLEFAQARYYSSSCGRFTSPDPYTGSMSLTDPQSFNRYSYVSNNPVNSTDPSGMSQRPSMMNGQASDMMASAQSGVNAIAEGEADYEYNLTHYVVSIKESEPIDEGMHEGQEQAAAATNSGNATPQRSETRGIVGYQEEHDERGGSKLSPCTKWIFQQLGFDKKIDLDKVRIHIGFSPFIEKFLNKLPGGAKAEAITWKNDIYFKNIDVFKPTSVDGLARIGHELAHVEQWAKFGDAFAEMYAGAWMRNGGYDRNMQFEKVPYQIEGELKIRIKQQFGSDPCKGFVQEIK